MPTDRSSQSFLRGAGRILLLFTTVLLAVGMIYYYSGVLISIRQKQFRVADSAPGNWSDLYPRWLGARELLGHGRNPYSPEVTQAIQRGFYGRPIDRSNRNDPKDPEAFAYPVYVVFLLAPFLPFSFDVARIVFKGVALLLTAASVLFWMRALRLRLSPWAAALALVATMCSYAVLDGLHLEQITLLVAAIMAASMAALVSGRLALAGVLLALATAKPQIVFLVAAFLLLWTLGDWRSRKRFAFAFGGAMAALLAGSELLVPGWFRFWLPAARAYVGYEKPSLLGFFLGNFVAMVVAAVAVGACGMLFWRFRKESAGSGKFNFAFITALVLTELVLPNAGRAYYNHVLLIPSCLWLFTSGWASAKESRSARITWVIVVSALVGQWILALPVSFAAFILHHTFERETTWFVFGPELMMLIFPLTLALFVLSAGAQLRRQSKVVAT